MEGGSRVSECRSPLNVHLPRLAQRRPYLETHAAKLSAQDGCLRVARTQEPGGRANDPSAALLERIYAEIRKLPPLDRSLVLLSLDGVSYADMAHIHGLSESNVGVRLNRARQQLARTMKGAADEL